MIAAVWAVFALLCTAARADIGCSVGAYAGCFYDEGDSNRTLPFTVTEGGMPISQTYCAMLCGMLNYKLAGVEYGTQCFCGNDYTYTPIREPDSDCNGMTCAGNSSQVCGNANRILVFEPTCTNVVPPNGHACLDPVSKALPFCNTALSRDARLDDLMNRLTQDEQLGLMGANTHTGVDSCSCMTSGVPRLGIPNYMQIVEVNSCVASACIAPQQCATNWVGPTGLAASFNRTLWHSKGVALSDEMRAMNNIGWFRGMGPDFQIGLLGYGPNINIARDPRFGRNSELPGEDPFLSGSYATEYVRGMQDGPDKKYLKMTSGLKHYTCYSVENDRAGRNFNVSTFDLFDTYLAQYKMAFAADGGNAQAAMCAYSSVNGVPMCANDYLINQVVRGKWNRSDVLIGTDCGAISNMVDWNHYASNYTWAAAATNNGGTDVNMGDNDFAPVIDGGTGDLPNAIALGWAKWSNVYNSARRTLDKRMRAGLFDPLDSTPYTKIGTEVINSTKHQQLNFEAALQSFVLLKNDDNTLPFPQGAKLAVVGPHIYSLRDLFEDYMGDMACYGGGFGCVATIADAFTAVNGAAVTQVAQGVDLYSNDTSGIPAALAAVHASDYVVLAIGIGNAIEHEGIDRVNITLPGIQDQFSQMVLAIGKPTVIVLINGGAVAIDNLVGPAPAIIEAFYPAIQGPYALTQAIFGHANMWGRLSITMYPGDIVNQLNMYNFNMSLPPGRTYRYYTGTPLFTFGHGLSYSSYSINCTSENKGNHSTHVDCSVKNVGGRDGQDVVMLYHRISPAIRAKLVQPAPLKQLIDFDRVAVSSGATKKASFDVKWDTGLVLTDNNGDKVLYPGLHYIDVWDGGVQTLTLQVTVPGEAPVIVDEAPRPRA